MPLAVTHVILTIVLVDLYRDYILKNKKYFTMHTVMIAGIAGLLPDIDIPLSKIFALFSIHIDLIEHGMITHTPIFGLIFLIPAFYFLKKENKTMAYYFFAITFGILFHIFLDLKLHQTFMVNHYCLWKTITQIWNTVLRICFHL